MVDFKMNMLLSARDGIIIQRNISQEWN